MGEYWKSQVLKNVINALVRSGASKDRSTLLQRLCAHLDFRVFRLILQGHFLAMLFGLCDEVRSSLPQLVCETVKRCSDLGRNLDGMSTLDVSVTLWTSSYAISMADPGRQSWNWLRQTSFHICSISEPGYLDNYKSKVSALELKYDIVIVHLRVVSNFMVGNSSQEFEISK